MSLDELMKAWQSQDAAPLYGVDRERLLYTLGQEQAKLQLQLRNEEWINYVTSAFLLAVMAFFWLIMIYDDDPRTTWDFFIPVVGVAAAVLWAGALYVSRRAQALRERRFGASLRDQVGRHLTMLEYQMTRVFRLASVLLTTLPVFVCATAIILAGWRINNEPFWDEWVWIVGGILMCGIGSVVGVWQQRRKVERDLLPRKRRLEALLKELDAP